MKPIRSGQEPCLASSLVASCLLACGQAQATTLPAANPIPATIPETSFALTLEKVIELPDSSVSINRFARIEQISPDPRGGDEIYVSDQRGKVYTFTPGDASPDLFYDFGANHPDFRDGNQSGLRGFAFHPNAYGSSSAPGYLKIYTAQDITFGGNHFSSVSEWSLSSRGAVIPNSRRDILFQSQPRGDHNIGKVKFNPHAVPGDDDYGLLYISFGDGGNYRSSDAGGSDTTLNPNGQNRNNFLGSILRINPVEDGDDPYTIPDTNPFPDTVGVRPEIWAYGLRNPHHFSWDRGGDHKMLIADIGQSNIEEINLGAIGRNYGWSIREGTFDMTDKAPDNPIAADTLPANHTTDPYTYPVAQYDHNFDNTGQVGAAIAGGYVYRGDRVPLLRGKYVFGNFGFTSDYQEIYVVDVDELEQRDDFTDLTSLNDGFIGPIQQLRLIDSNEQAVKLLDLVRDESGSGGQSRTDMRFGIDNHGEVYVSSKKSGTIWRFAATPKITITPNGDGQSTISWEPETPGWVLEESTSLEEDDWEDTPGGSSSPVVVPSNQSRKFYRMHQP